MAKKVLYDCKQATYLIVKREEGRISIPDRLRLYYHLFYCSVCRNFSVQSALINRVLKNFGAGIASRPPFKIDERRKNELQKEIDGLTGKKY